VEGDLARLLTTHAGPGRLETILLRPARLTAPQRVPTATLTPSGLTGDHARPGPRALTLIQAEHLSVIAALAHLPEVAPETLRRNLVISGINLAALRDVPLRIGEATIRITVPCVPCSRMETALGPGGYTAMRTHGGWCAEVLSPGAIEKGDPVQPAPP
jgi:MOSC domain-containing protein YiiM